MTFRHLRTSGILAVVVTMLFGTLTTAASATPADDKRAEAARIAARRQQLVQTAERLNEESKAAEETLAGLNAELATTGTALAERDASLSQMNSAVASFALKSYIFGRGAGELDVVSGMDAINASAVKEGYSAALLGSAGDAVDVIRAARQDIDHIVKDLAVKQQRHIQLKGRISTNQAKVTETQAQLDDIAKHLDAELAVLVADEEAKQEQERMLRERQASERAAAKAPSTKAVQNAAPANPRPATTPTISAAASTPARPAAKPAIGSTPPTAPSNSSTSSRPTSPATAKPVTTKPTSPPVVVPNYPAPSGGAAIAIAEAKRQLGKPYVFGTNGPNTFDCSGLTQWAWAKAGVSMSHYTVSQYSEFPHIPVDALQPGDLVFFKIDLGHMGMYLGGGLVIHAPQTGDVVKISPLSNFNVVGAARPG